MTTSNKSPYFIIDAHQDIAENCLHTTGKDFFQKNGLHQGQNDLGFPVNNQSDYFRLREGGVKIVFGVVFSVLIDAQRKFINDPHLCYQEAKKQLQFYRQMEQSGKVRIIDSEQDLEDVLNTEGLIGLFLLMEGAEGISSNLNELDEFYAMGLRAVGPVWNLDNVFGGGTNSDQGISEAGIALLKKMQELGMVLDTAHMNKVHFHQALSLKPQLVINSHVCAQSLNNIRRNIDDDQIKAIAELGGVTCVAAHPSFAADNPTLAGIYDHIMHAVSVAGEDAVGIGSDFDGTSSKVLVDGLSSADQFAALREMILEKQGLKNPEKLFNQNLLRIIKKSLNK